MRSFARMNRRDVMSLMAAGSAVATMPNTLFAKGGYPVNPVEYLIPFSPGGGMDNVARIIGPKLEQRLGAPFLMVNKPGATGFVASNYMAGKEADGYTAIQHSLGSFCLRSMLTPQDIDPMTGMRYLGQIALLNAGLAVRADSPYETLDDLLEAMRADPHKINWGHAGMGGFTHVNGVALMAATGAQAQDVPFKGSAPNMAALVGGHLDASILNTSNSVGFEEEIRFLTVFARKRDTLVPDVPAIGETGIKMTPVESPAVIAVKPGTAEEIVDILKAAIRESAAEQDYQDQLVKLGLIPAYEDEEAILSFMENSVPEWRATVDLVKQNA